MIKVQGTKKTVHTVSPPLLFTLKHNDCKCNFIMRFAEVKLSIWILQNCCWRTRMLGRICFETLFHWEKSWITQQFLSSKASTTTRTKRIVKMINKNDFRFVLCQMINEEIYLGLMLCLLSWKVYILRHLGWPCTVIMFRLRVIPWLQKRI